MEEKAGIRFLVKAPNKKTLGSTLAGGVQQFFQKSSRNGCFASAPEPNQGYHSVESALVGLMQHLHFRIPADKMRRRRQRMNNLGLGRMNRRHECIFIARAPPPGRTLSLPHSIAYRGFFAWRRRL